MSRYHIPKVDTGDDYDFMCGTCAFGATIGARSLCQACVKKSLAIVELLSDAYDELKAINDARPFRRRARLLRRIDKALGKRATVDYPVPETEETA